MMLKNFFISMLGALTAFWISIMLLFILGVVFAAGTIVSAIGGAASVAVEKNSVLYLPLSGVIEERQTAVEFTSLINQEARPVALDDIIRSISAAAMMTASRVSTSTARGLRPEWPPALPYARPWRISKREESG